MIRLPFGFELNVDPIFELSHDIYHQCVPNIVPVINARLPITFALFLNRLCITAEHIYIAIKSCCELLFYFFHLIYHILFVCYPYIEPIITVICNTWQSLPFLDQIQIVVGLILFIAKWLHLHMQMKNREIVVVVVDPQKQIKEVSNTLVVCVAIEIYNDNNYGLDTRDDIKLYRELFKDKYNYRVLANEWQKPVNYDDLDTFLRRISHEDLSYDYDNKKLKYYDSLIVTFGSHGTHDSIICSDGKKFKHKDLRAIFHVPELKDIPKIFIIDACRTNVAGDDGQKARASPSSEYQGAFSTTIMTGEGRQVKGAKLCQYLTEELSKRVENNHYNEFRDVYLEAKKKIRKTHHELILCEHDTDIEAVVFKPRNEKIRGPSPPGDPDKRRDVDQTQQSLVS